MEPFTVAVVLAQLAAPFLLKAGEAAAEKAGEGAWTFITSKFKSKELAAIDPTKGPVGPDSVEILKQALLKEMQADPGLLEQGQRYLTQIQPATTIVNQYGDKSFNVGNNLGTIRFN
jgi:hypothetical protein